MNWPMAGVDSNGVVFGMDAKASPQGGVYGDLSAVNSNHGQGGFHRLNPDLFAALQNCTRRLLFLTG